MASSAAEIRLRIGGARALKVLDRRLREAARKDLQDELRKGLVRAANPTIRDLRSAVMAVQVTAKNPAKKKRNYPHRPLRATVRRGLALSYKTRGAAFVRIQVKKSAFPQDEWSLPKYLDGTIKPYDRWRYPYWNEEFVAGRVGQNYGQPWFFVTIDKHRANMRAEMVRGMARVARKIGGA